MVRRAAQITPGRGSLASGDSRRSAPPPLLIRAPQAEEPHASDLPREHMTCLAHYWLVFDDPQWGPVSMQLSIWRDDQADLPDYIVDVV